jgi:hypothetical protein
MVAYFREDNGDYLAIDLASNAHYRRLGRDDFEGRAAAIAGQVGSVCTTGVSREYLRTNCKQVPGSAVPVDWRRALAC